MRASDVTFRNWARTTQCDAAILAPRSLDELQEVVARAARRGRVRALGGGHAFAPLVPTDGTLVDMRYLQRCLGVNADPRGPTITVEAGMTMRRLSNVAQLHGLTSVSPTVFALITVGGAVATASHGSGLSVSTWSDQVVAMTVVDARGELVRIAADDPRLPAASAALGTFGVVYGLTVRAEPAHNLVFRQCKLPVEEALASLVPTTLAHDFVETYWFPCSKNMWTLTADRTPLPDRPRSVVTSGIRSLRDGLAYAAGGIIPRLSRRAPALTMQMPRLGDLFTFNDGVEVLSAPEAFHYHVAYPRIWDFSIATPLDRAHDAWRILMSLVEEEARRGRYPINMVAHARYLGEGRAWLSPTYRQATCAIEVVTCPDTPGALEFFARLQRRMFAEIPGSRPHWGKILVEPETLRDRFAPEAVDSFLRERDRFDPSRVFMNAFVADTILRLPKQPRVGAAPPNRATAGC
jgi:L-gulonolactone oxidase